jgi:hypothetical protein
VCQYLTLLSDLSDFADDALEQYRRDPLLGERIESFDRIWLATGWLAGSGRNWRSGSRGRQCLERA